MKFHLVADRRGCRVERGGTLIFERSRYEALPAVPPVLPSIYGDHAAVNAHAYRLNRLQEAEGYLDYLYSPDIYSEAKS